VTLCALDLFCGCGGSSHGLQLAGLHVVGVDLVQSPRYCGDAFFKADVLSLPIGFFRTFDLIWASPPCQAHTVLKHAHNAKKHEDLIAATRARLVASGVDYVIENVIGAPLINPFQLCGTSFNLRLPDGTEIWRHRLFETNFPVSAPQCAHRPGARVCGIYGSHFRDRRRPAGTNHRSGSNIDRVTALAAMGVPWMSVAEASQAIPPIFARFIALQWLNMHGRHAA